MQQTLSNQLDAKLWQNLLLTWYATYGRKNLPWKNAPKDLRGYYTLVSEYMLQQTQATRVAEYFVRFIGVFPNLTSLANAPIDQVLTQWSGLGYYRRANFLHISAKQIYARMQSGEDFPQEPQVLMSFPGIGRSTANAIAAQAFQQPYAIVDANVRRILQRLRAKPQIDENTLWQWAQHLTPHNNAGDYCQAIMDFGALVCTRTPACQSCFANHMCMAYQTNQVAHIPTKKHVKKKRLRMVAALVTAKQQVWLEPNAKNNLWSGLLGPIWAESLHELKNALQSRFGYMPCYRSRTCMQFTLTHRLVRVHLFMLVLDNTSDVHNKHTIDTSIRLSSTEHTSYGSSSESNQTNLHVAKPVANYQPTLHTNNGNWYSLQNIDFPLSSASRAMLAKLGTIESVFKT